MPPTIRDVARRAGVSVATVSRVLRGNDRVTSGTRAQVLAAVDELRFVPSPLGRSLAERRHAADGIVFPDLSGPYFAEVLLGYEAAAGELGRSVLILSTRGRAAASAMVDDLARRCDGLVVMGRTVPDAVLRGIAARGVPLLLVARPRIDGLDSVTTENVTTAVTLARHVIGRGARTLAFVGDPEASPDVAGRFEGVRRAADAAGARLHLLSTAGFGEADAAALVPAALRRGLPDAFLCANDELALGLLTALRSAGVEVPGRVRVTGWDDVMAARYAGLTTVRQPMRELGATAARQLDELVRGGRREPRHTVLPTALVVRTSCGTPARGSS